MNVNINQSLFNVVIAFGGFVGGAAALALLYAGFLFIFAGDNPQQEQRAKAAIGFAIVGAVIAIGAVSLANTITTNIK
jgi:hypothetical protein